MELCSPKQEVISGNSRVISVVQNFKGNLLWSAQRKLSVRSICMKNLIKILLDPEQPFGLVNRLNMFN